MMKFSILLFLLLFTLASPAQTDVPYSRDYEFKEGVFLTYEHFRNNDPIPRSAIVSFLPSNHIDFMTEVMDQKILTYKDSAGAEQKIETSQAWGYCQNRAVYVNFNHDFNRLNVIGTLSLFSSVIVRTPIDRDPMGDIYSVSAASEELRQFVLDTRNNKVYDFNVKNMEVLLKNDSELYEAFMKLKKRAKSDSVFIYLRKYNEKHPLYLAAN